MANKVIAHIAGPSGSGKTTLGEQISKNRPDLNVVDLDDFDDEAAEQLGYSGIKKNHYTNSMLRKLAKRRQELMDQHIENATKPIVYVGHHWEGQHTLSIPTENKFRIDVDAKTAAERAYKRSQNEEPKYRRKLSELPGDVKEAKEDIARLNHEGYKAMSPKEILRFFDIDEDVKV